MKRLIARAALLLGLAAASVAAQADPLVRLSVLDIERMEHLPTWPHRGLDYVEGQPGHRYAVVLQNLTGERVLAVVSVDGVNAISGETAGSQQSGYVLEPWQRLEVRGWRKNLSEVAEFHFTSLGGSYAARTGRPQNVGVIGVAAFREKYRAPVPYYSQPGGGYPMPPPAPYYRDEAEARSQRAPVGAAADAAAPAAEAGRAHDGYAGAAAPKARQQLGTGHGERRWDAATQTTFERRSSRPDQVATLYYDATEALVARGILPRPRQPHWGVPQAFPTGFAPDPR